MGDPVSAAVAGVAFRADAVAQQKMNARFRVSSDQLAKGCMRAIPRRAAEPQAKWSAAVGKAPAAARPPYLRPAACQSAAVGAAHPYVFCEARCHPGRLERGKNTVTNVLHWACIQNELRLVEFNRLNWPAMRKNAEEALKTMASLKGEKLDEKLQNNAQEAAYHHLIRAAFEFGDYAAARHALDDWASRTRPLEEDADLQRRFDLIGNQLTRILVLARSNEGAMARTELAKVWPEVEAVFAAGPEHHFNQVQMARALSVKAEVETLDTSARRALLERAAGYLRPAADAGRLTRYERAVLLAAIEKILTTRPPVP